MLQWNHKDPQRLVLLGAPLLVECVLRAFAIAPCLLKQASGGPSSILTSESDSPAGSMAGRASSSSSPRLTFPLISHLMSLARAMCSSNVDLPVGFVDYTSCLHMDEYIQSNGYMISYLFKLCSEGFHVLFRVPIFFAHLLYCVPTVFHLLVHTGSPSPAASRSF